MKSVFDMKGAERAAALLMALGKGLASDIMKNLDEESIEKISLEMARIDSLSPEDREDLIGEFLIELRKSRRSMSGGEDKARSILKEAFGRERAQEILKRAAVKDLEGEFSFLKKIDTEPLITLLKDEHPQAVAVAFKYLPPEKAAAVIQAFPPETAKDVAKRLARSKGGVPEAELEIARGLRKKYVELAKKERSFQKAGGFKALVDIVNWMNPEDEKNLLHYFDSALPEVSEKIRSEIFAFENAANLSNREMRILIDEINSDFLIAKSLKGAGDETRFKFLRNMSQNRASDILAEMDRMGPVRRTEVEECRREIVEIMKDLHEKGEISLRNREFVF